MNAPTITGASRWALAAALCAGFLPSGLNESGRAGAAQYNMDSIVSAWEQRRRSITSFQYQCRLETRIPKGAYNGRAMTAHARSDVPPADVVLGGTVRFAVSGGEMAYHEDREIWDEIGNRPKRNEVFMVFDGGQTRTLMPGSPPTLGELNHDGKPDELLTNGLFVQAFWFWYWPTLRQIDASKFAARNEEAYYDGKKCIVLERETIPAVPTVQVLVYVDPARGFLPVRCVTEKNGVLFVDLCVQYAPTDPVGWRVAGWTDNSFDPANGVVTATRKGSVTDWAINQPVDHAQFSLEFPAGANVVELGGPGRSDEKYFVVEKDGTRRYISQSEFGRLPGPQPSAWWRVRWGAGIAGILAIGAIVLLLSRRRKAG